MNKILFSAGLLCLLALPASAQEVQSTVVDVEVDGDVSVTVQSDTEGTVSGVVENEPEDPTLISLEDELVEVTNIDIDDSFVGLDIEEPGKAPGAFGLWWRNIKESISIAFTFDPVEKAEKRLRFAEENMRLAQYIADNAENEAVRERAQKRIEIADRYLQKLEETKEKWVNNPKAEAKNLLRNIATHQLRKQEIEDKIEEILPEDKIDAFQERRQQALESSQRLLNALENENIVEEVKSHLEDVKAMIEQKQASLLQYQLEKKEILRRIQDGDTEAKSELDDIRNTRMENLRQAVEQVRQIKEIRQNNAIEAIREQVKEQNEGDDQQIRERIRENEPEHAVEPNRAENASSDDEDSDEEFEDDDEGQSSSGSSARPNSALNGKNR